jgi:hypothetical protein
MREKGTRKGEAKSLFSRRTRAGVMQGEYNYNYLCSLSSSAPKALAVGERRDGDVEQSRGSCKVNSSQSLVGEIDSSLEQRE